MPEARGEGFYRAVRAFGRMVFRIASKPRIIHAERAQRQGAYLLAANHESAFDAALLIAATPRVIYWLSIVEAFRHPFSRWFLTSMKASPLDRSKVDTVTMRRIMRHLREGKVVGIFPEGGLKRGDDSVLRRGSINEGVCKISHLARAPILPCVVLGGENFSHWRRWLPGAGARWTVIFGEPIFPHGGEDRDAACGKMVQDITLALRALFEEGKAHV